jgi:hypothetical protein
LLGFNELQPDGGFEEREVKADSPVRTICSDLDELKLADLSITTTTTPNTTNSGSESTASVSLQENSSSFSHGCCPRLPSQRHQNLVSPHNVINDESKNYENEDISIYDGRCNCQKFQNISPPPFSCNRKLSNLK